MAIEDIVPFSWRNRRKGPTHFTFKDCVLLTNVGDYQKEEQFYKIKLYPQAKLLELFPYPKQVDIEYKEQILIK